MIAVVGKRRAAAAADPLQSAESANCAIRRTSSGRSRLKALLDAIPRINVTVPGAYKAEHDFLLAC
jgi:hypothetical protein